MLTQIQISERACFNALFIGANYSGLTSESHVFFEKIAAGFRRVCGIHCVLHQNWKKLRAFLFGLLTLLSLSTYAANKACTMDSSQEAVISKLFSQQGHVYSLLWWTDPKSNVINARSFVINGHDSIPIFSSEASGKSQVAGSGYEKNLVGVKPELLASILQRMEYAILNPAGANPIQFRTCILKKYMKGKSV